MDASSTELPTRTTMPPRMSGSTFDWRSTFRSVCSAIRSPICLTVAFGSSTAEVTVTGRSLFSSSQSCSNSARTRKSTGMRCFSISSLRKLSTVSSAPETALSRPSVFSLVEKYGENRNTCSSRDSLRASANSPSSSRTLSSLSCSFATSKRERA